MAGSPVELTVAICTRDRRDSLLRAIESLAGQRSRASWELLVVDNASRDDTRSSCEAASRDFPVTLRVVDEPTAGLSHARNRALHTALGRAVVFIDDDVSCRPGFVDGHARAFAQADVLATGGRIIPVVPPGLWRWWRTFLERELGGPTSHYDFGLEVQEIRGAEGVPLPFGANMGVTREPALEIGGFRSDLGWGRELVPGEETEFLGRLAAGPGRMLYVPTAVVDHYLGVERSRFAFYRRWHRGYGRAQIRMNRPASASRALIRIACECARGMARAARGCDPIRAVRTVERTLGQLLELFRCAGSAAH